MQGKKLFTSIREHFNDGVTFELNLGGQIRILYAENVGKGLQKDHLDQVQI